MKEEELRDNINIIAQKIMQFEEMAKKKEDYIKQKLDEDYNPKINSNDLKLAQEQERLNQISQRIDLLTAEKKKSLSIIKNLQQENRSLKREKEKNLNSKLKAIVKEKNLKTKEINKEIKKLEKQLKEI
jgi:hypothetical protein